MTINTLKTQWQFLEPRLSSWRKQLYLKGRKLTAFTVWSDMIANEDTLDETATRGRVKLSRRVTPPTRLQTTLNFKKSLHQTPRATQPCRFVRCFREKPA
jgi:hypothetical protein